MMVRIVPLVFIFFPLVKGALARSFDAAPRDLPQVKEDLADLSTKITTLDDALTAYPPSGDLVQALAVDRDALDVASGLQKTAADVTSTGPVSDEDSVDILNTVKAAVPIIQHALVTIVDKKSGFTSLPIAGIADLILQDLTWLDGNSTILANALIAIAPEDLKPEATELKNSVESAFDTAIAAYSS